MSNPNPNFDPENVLDEDHPDAEVEAEKAEAIRDALREEGILEENETDDDSDYKVDNGNTPVGYPSDGPDWFGAK
jgi:hypothetical protein